MKTVEEISKLSVKDLETIADDESIAVPGNVRGKIVSRLEPLIACSPENAGDRQKTSAGKYRMPLAVSVCAAASIAVVAVLSATMKPEDTFSDPDLAYVEVEKTLAYISSKLDRGAEIMNEAEDSGLMRIETVFEK